MIKNMILKYAEKEFLKRGLKFTHEKSKEGEELLQRLQDELRNTKIDLDRYKTRDMYQQNEIFDLQREIDELTQNHSNEQLEFQKQTDDLNEKIVELKAEVVKVHGALEIIKKGKN